MQLGLLQPVMPVIIDIALIIVLTPLAILLAGHLAGVEKATPLRSIVIAIFGLLTLGVLVLDLVLQFAGGTAPMELSSLYGLEIPQRLAVYMIVWILLIKLGFESSFLDAFTVGVSAAVILIILTWLIIVITTPIWTGLFSR